MADERVVTAKRKPDDVPPLATTLSAAGGSDPFMGFPDRDDPLESCTLPRVAVARGVTSAATTPVSESAPPNFSPISAAETSRPFLTEQTAEEAACREGDDDGTGCATPCSSDSATSMVTPCQGITLWHGSARVL